MSFTEEELLEVVQAVERHGSQRKAAKELNLSRRALQRRLYRSVEIGLDGSVPIKSPLGRRINGVSTLYDADGNKRAQWVKESAEPSLESLVETIKEAFENLPPQAVLPPRPINVNEQLLSVYPIADLHLGMMSWGDETGEDYDLKIAKRRLTACYTDLISQSPASEQAIILNLGDYFHTNDASNATPGHGHLLDVDSRYPKMISEGVWLMIDIINLALQKHETVKAVNIPGNHDRDSVVALRVALDCYFRNNDRVEIDMNPGEWFFDTFGNTLFGANHGHKAKPEQMVLKMANDRREDWGKTKYRWLMFGHIHHQTGKDIGGVYVESFQTLASKDAFAANGGYISGQSLVSITLHKERGEIGRHRVNF